MIGRPSKYSEDLADKLCMRIAEGESLKRICESEDMPSRKVVHEWLLDERKKSFRDKYARAVDVRTENMFDELLDIADDGTNDWMEKEGKNGNTYYTINGEAVARSRLRADTRKWYLSKIMPKKYGDRIQQDHSIAGVMPADKASEITKMMQDAIEKMEE